MAIEEPTIRSRRAILAAAAAGAAGLAASAIVAPLEVAAAPGDPMKIDQDNPTTMLTSITQGGVDAGGFKAVGNGAGTGVEGDSTGGIGVKGVSATAVAVAGASSSAAGVEGRTATDATAGVVGFAGDPSGSTYATKLFPLDTGLYGYADIDTSSSGVFGETGANGLVGVFGSGFFGIQGSGVIGGGMFGDELGAMGRSDAGTGVAGHCGLAPRPNPPATTALYGSVSAANQVGIQAGGRILFPDRAKRARISKGKTSVTVSVPGMTSANVAIAVMNTNQSGRWVRAAVCATGKLTIYLNTKTSATAYVSWLVLG